MTVLAPKKPFESREPVLTIDELPVGAHVLRLVVVDDEGNSSDPFDVTIEVTQRGVIVPPRKPPRTRTTKPPRIPPVKPIDNQGDDQ